MSGPSGPVRLVRRSPPTASGASPDRIRRPRRHEKGTSLSVLIVTSKAAPAHTGELEAAAQKMFAAIERQAPKGIKYASCRLADGVTYVAVLEVQDGVENPLPSIPEFQEFQQGLRTWIAEPPNAGPATVIGNYQ